MGSEATESIQSALVEASALMLKAQEGRESTKLACLICYDYPLDSRVAFMVNKALRRLGKVKNLDLLLESGGGDIDVSAKIAKLCLSHCEHFRVIVPFYAKSAATLIACFANELVLPPSGELGPVDPQVVEPVTKHRVPAHSIQETVRFIEAAEDPLIKVAMADKLSPLLIGAWEDARKASAQYVEEALNHISPEDRRNRAIYTFTDRFKSHGYPIDRTVCQEAGLKVACEDPNFEELMCQLHQIYLDCLLGSAQQAVIVQTDSSVDGIVDDEPLVIPDLQQAKGKASHAVIG